MTLKRMRSFYKRSLKNKDWNYIDIAIAPCFWEQYARNFTNYIMKWYNPNPYDTPNYFSMKPSEQVTMESSFMDDVLVGKLDLREYPKVSEEKHKEIMKRV